MNIRNTKQSDISALQKVLEGTELFPPEMLPEMLHDYFNGNKSGSFWFTIEQDDRPVAFSYVAPEELSDRTFNLVAIAVLPEMQASGIGSAMLRHIESVLRAENVRVLVIDTSGAEAFRQTRQFYLKNDYVEEARIRDFWAEGDDKVIYWKSL